MPNNVIPFPRPDNDENPFVTRVLDLLGFMEQQEHEELFIQITRIDRKTIRVGFAVGAIGVPNQGTGITEPMWLELTESGEAS